MTDSLRMVPFQYLSNNFGKKIIAQYENMIHTEYMQLKTTYTVVLYPACSLLTDHFYHWLTMSETFHTRGMNNEQNDNNTYFIQRMSNHVDWILCPVMSPENEENYFLEN